MLASCEGEREQESCRFVDECPALPTRFLDGDRRPVSLLFTISSTRALASLTASVAAAGGMLEGVELTGGRAAYVEAVDVTAAEVICGHGLVAGAGNYVCPPATTQ